MLNIHDEIDMVLGEGIEKLRKKYKSMRQDEFSGQVAGLLMVTAIKMAKAGGCPRDLFEAGALARIEKEYGP